MEITQIYNPEVVHWKLSDNFEFQGSVAHGSEYGMGLTPPEPNNEDYSYFTVNPTLTATREGGELLFRFEVEVVFQIKNNKVCPQPEFLFECVKQARFIANEMLKGRFDKTVMFGRSIPEPDYYHVYPDLIQASLLAYPEV